MTSCLLGRKELSETSIPTLDPYLQRLVAKHNPTAAALTVIVLHSGQGPRNVLEVMRGSPGPAWRLSYIHVLSYGASTKYVLSPQEVLGSGAQWLEETKSVSGVSGCRPLVPP
ncbi:hypothetical protein LZ31DRAFT_188778 [Colletotrichum somersetense]|nr:hypothetical protein LZ31DRAFT_188778 [Colletotrichum somersetense]